MPEKDPTTYSWITYGWVLALSSWGGLVSWYNKRKAGYVRPFNIAELLGELTTSAFAGMLTFWLCESTGISPLMTAAFVGISGHMGSRAVFCFEQYLHKKFGADKL